MGTLGFTWVDLVGSERLGITWVILKARESHTQTHTHRQRISSMHRDPTGSNNQGSSWEDP